MNVSLDFKTGPIKDVTSDVIVVILSRDVKLCKDKTLAALVDPLYDSYLKEKIKVECFLDLPQEFNTRQLLVYFADNHKNMSVEDKVATSISSITAICALHGFNSITIPFSNIKAFALKAVQGLYLGNYSFKQYKSKQDNSTVTVTFHVDKALRPAFEKIAERDTVISNCVNQCRNLVNEPANIAGTDEVLKRAKDVAKECGLSITVLEKDELRNKGYNGLLTVGSAGRNPPRMVVLSYIPKNKSKQHLCLVGKGIVFDSGGICLKPADSMWTMKDDMAGAAAVLYGLKALSLLKYPVKVTAILCLAENLPDSNATRPGDIFIAANKKSVHVENTDAEGRLILTDGLYMAQEVGATHIIDFATLTGACVVALGEHIAGLMGNNNALIKIVQSAAKAGGDPVWHLPLPPEYKPMLDTPYADINNITGSRWGGALTAGLFLGEFVPENTAWVHLDIAGPAFTVKKWMYYNEGATGFGVRIIANLPTNFS